jgi:hypothetical protein
MDGWKKARARLRRNGGRENCEFNLRRLVNIAAFIGSEALIWASMYPDTRKSIPALAGPSLGEDARSLLDSGG